MKTLGKRKIEGRPLKDAEILLRTIRRLRGDALTEKGVFRFKTHEEADRWMTKMIANIHARLSCKTS
jgi:hypothetical protein